MALSQDLINQFVKLTNKEEKPKEVTVNGTYKTIENGVPVDYEISKNLWYDYPNLTKKIDDIVASLNK